MILAGVLRLRSLLRFVSNAVMVRSVKAEGVKIVLDAFRQLHRGTPLEGAITAAEPV